MNKKETRCQFWIRCNFAHIDDCSDPDKYNGLESECPMYFNNVKKFIHIDKESLKEDDINMIWRERHKIYI